MSELYKEIAITGYDYRFQFWAKELWWNASRSSSDIDVAYLNDNTVLVFIDASKDLPAEIHKYINLSGYTVETNIKGGDE